MDTELINIFDDNKKQIGVATRKDVHTFGYWHESFHCWFIGREKENDYIYLQLRSEVKSDYPNLLDITAAGHIMSNETVTDGIREIKEEIGIDLTIDELESLGVVDYVVINDNFIDKELASVYLYRYNSTFDEFILQKEEVSGIFKAEFNDFCALWYGEKSHINVEGFIIDPKGNRVMANKVVGEKEFVPHEKSFYQTIVKLISEKLNGE
ncbi:NUDIX domain-containing protein [Paenibacillus sp. GCM10028914]|uniref:NUDIX hydrolase n=1 Tax=Paenibacillus sp. GCM10028914 TaxID=3273416 RepID=UPI0036206A65